jgi:hypothetical protein
MISAGAKSTIGQRRCGPGVPWEWVPLAAELSGRLCFTWESGNWTISRCWPYYFFFRKEKTFSSSVNSVLYLNAGPNWFKVMLCIVGQ